MNRTLQESKLGLLATKNREFMSKLITICVLICNRRVLEASLKLGNRTERGTKSSMVRRNEGGLEILTA